MKPYISSDDKTLTHLLGYLDKDEWADAIVHYPELDREIIKMLLKNQNAYSRNTKLEDAVALRVKQLKDVTTR